MKQVFFFIAIIIFLISCEKNHKGNMIVQGNIKGLKKGTLYLKKLSDTLFVSVDSIQLDGESNFILSDEVKSPEMYYLTLKENPNEIISFFGEKGKFSINTKLSKFEISAKITGLKNQKLLEEYNSMMSRFKISQLDIVKDRLEVQIGKSDKTLEEIDNDEKNLLKRKYLYIINFALTNTDSEIAPYLTLNELYNANIIYLDSINNSLSKKVKKSKYAIQLNDFILEIKENEK